jgi:hypothetical protein
MPLIYVRKTLRVKSEAHLVILDARFQQVSPRDTPQSEYVGAVVDGPMCLALLSQADESSTGPASLALLDPDGNPILIDQHVPRPRR